MSVKFRLAQHDCTLANFAENLNKHIALCEQAIRDGVEFIAFPELSLTGYLVQDAAQDLAMPISDERLYPLRELSKHISILCGGIELSDDFAVYNSAFFFEDGIAKTVHRKIYPPTYGMFEELRYFHAGQRIEPFESRRLGKVGIAICEDNWHVSVPLLHALQGAKVIISMVNSPLRIDFEKGEIAVVGIWQRLTRTYAALFSVYVVFVSRVGNEDGLSYWGGSEVISPEGIQVAALPQFVETTLDCEIDLNAVKRARLRSSHFLDEDVRLIAAEFQRILNKT
ncbi:MAG: nitrilase-related carbon-nitrogen hydrolase [Candidatus Thermochlorobacter sp.]